jgi:hypothetical protein
LARSFTPPNYLWLNPIVSRLCTIKVVDPDLFRRAKANRITLADIKSVFATAGWKSDGHQKWMLEWWIFCLAERQEDHPDLDWKGFGNSLVRYSLRDRKSIVGLMAGHIDRLQLPSR